MNAGVSVGAHVGFHRQNGDIASASCGDLRQFSDASAVFRRDAGPCRANSVAQRDSQCSPFTRRLRPTHRGFLVFAGLAVLGPSFNHGVSGQNIDALNSCS